MTTSNINPDQLQDAMPVSKTALRQTLLTIKNEMENGGFTSLAGSSISRTGDAKHNDTVSILDFGVVGDNKADDTLAIQQAFDACAVSGKALWFPSGHTFIVSSALTADGSFSIIMDGRLRKNGNGSYTSLRIGQTVNPTYVYRPRYFKINVVDNRYDWTDTSKIGIEFCNITIANIWIVDVEGFHTGILFSGRGDANAYNKVELGRIANNKVGLRLAAENSGFVNENHFFGGAWQVADGVNAGEAMYGIVLDHFEAGQPVFDNNIFHKPSIEIGSIGRASIPISIANGNGNRFYDVRSEGNDPQVAVVTGTSSENYVSTFGQPARGSRTKVTDTSTSPSTTLVTQHHIGPSQASWHVVGNLAHKCVGTGEGRLTCAGAAFCSAITPLGNLYNSQKSDTYFSVTRSGLRIGIFWAGLTVRVRTNATKKFWIKRTLGQNISGRLLDGDIHANAPYVRCWSSNGTLLTGTNPYYARTGPNGTMTFVQGGGGYRSLWTIDPDYPSCIELHPSVAYADIGISGSGISNGIAITTDDGLIPQIDTPWAHETEALASVEPDQGYFWPGRMVRNLAPASGQPTGWICTAAGWRARDWVAGTSYSLWQLVKNDGGKIYECTDAGTSAGSKGPTGTGPTIVDNGVKWAYVGAQATFAPLPNLP